MRKVLLSLLVCLFLVSNCYALYTSQDNIAVRSGVTTDDDVADSIATGSGINGSLYESFLVEAILTGSNSVIITPLYNIGNGYKAGSGTTVATSSMFTINTYGCSDIYMRVSNRTVAGGTVTINIKPYRYLQQMYHD